MIHAFYERSDAPGVPFILKWDFKGDTLPTPQHWVRNVTRVFTAKAEYRDDGKFYIVQVIEEKKYGE
jgi:hypothetical protein